MEVELQPRLRIARCAAPAGLRVLVEHGLRIEALRTAGCRDDRRHADRAVLEAEILQPHRALAAGTRAYDELDRAEFAQCATARRTPGEFDLAALENSPRGLL